MSTSSTKEPVPSDLAHRSFGEINDWLSQHRGSDEGPEIPITDAALNQAHKEIYVLLGERFGITVDRNLYVNFELLAWTRFLYLQALKLRNIRTMNPDNPEYIPTLIRNVNIAGTNLKLAHTLLDQQLQHLDLALRGEA